MNTHRRAGARPGPLFRLASLTVALFVVLGANAAVAAHAALIWS